MTEESLLGIPKTFAQAVATVRDFALWTFKDEIAQKQLYYHTYTHVGEVKQRARAIFQILRPYWQAIESNGLLPESLARMELLLDLCAVAHDMIQIFLPQNQPHSTRRREAGASETETIKQLLAYIQSLNEQIEKHGGDSDALFTAADRLMLQEAIAATICDYDPLEGAIYQPALYNPQKPLSPVARIIALADIGTLGMEGIAAYNREGGLLFLEENPDIILLITHKQTKTLASDNPVLYENLRQRLLKRAHFQVNFAKSRLKRSLNELAGFPIESLSRWQPEIFPYLTEKTIQEIEATTPRDKKTSLEALIEFFELESLLCRMDVSPNPAGSGITMLMLLFYIGDDLYAIESSHVVEVIPRVALRKIHHVPDYVAGLFNYRGTIVPVVDLCHLLQGTPSRFYLSTRIMMVNYPRQTKAPQHLGLIAERITKTVNQPETAVIETGLRVQNAPYLGGMMMGENGIIQQIHLERLFADVQTIYLLMAGENENNQ